MLSIRAIQFQDLEVIARDNVLDKLIEWVWTSFSGRFEALGEVGTRERVRAWFRRCLALRILELDDLTRYVELAIAHGGEFEDEYRNSGVRRILEEIEVPARARLDMAATMLAHRAGAPAEGSS